MSDEAVTPEVDPEEIKTPWLTNKSYDILKYVALVLLPALGTMYFALSNIWGLPYAEQIVGTIVVVDTFLGVIIRYAARQYENTGAKYDGDIVVTETESGSLFSLNLNSDPAELQGKHEVVFKVTS